MKPIMVWVLVLFGAVDVFAVQEVEPCVLTQLDPGYFAAAAPSAGSGLVKTEDFVDVSVIKDIPFWIFHGDKDPKCPIEKDQKIFAAMKTVAGNMKFTTWKGDKHGGPVAVKMLTGSDNGTTQMSSDRCDPEPVFLKWLFSQKRNAGSKPNILLILADDMGYSDLGCMGSEIKTPNLDWIAKNGILFTQAYNTAKCYPTRASLLTGAYFQQTDQDFSNTTTLGEMLRPASYNTLWSGKHHAGFDPRTRGFDRFYGFLGGAINCWNPGETAAPGARQPAYIGGYKWVLDKPGVVKSFVPDRADWYSTDVFTDKGIQWLEKTKDDGKPFLLYMAYNAPHWPLHAPQENIDRCQGRYDAGYDAIRNARYERQIASGLFDPGITNLPAPDYDQPWDELTPEQRDRRIRQMEVYAAMVERLDENIGRLTDLLRKQGRLENTLILFLSDNGACAETPTKRVKNYSADVPIGGVESYESYGKGWACVGNTPLRKFKQDSFEGGICTAMIAHWPKGIAAPGRINRDPVHLIDIMPTLAALSAAKTPGNAQGISIVPAFKNKPLIRAKDMFWQFGSGQAIRRGDMKLVTQKQKPWELYDLANDRTEMRNLASQNPDLVQQLERSWNTWWMDCTGSEYSGKKKKNRQMDEN